MKPVYSNPKGHHIHSPFAFELVTKVIFRSASEVKKDSPRLTGQADKFSQRMWLIRRLIEFFQPATVWAPAGKREMMELISVGLQWVNLEYYTGNQLSDLSLNNELVIVDQPAGMPECIPVNDCNSVWFIDVPDTGENRNYFATFKNHPKVSQTYALKNCGIVIFNPRYQKQDFIIRGNYSL